MVIIFDLDGTLLDTFPVVKNSYIQVFKNHLPSHQYTEDDLKSYFGPPLIDTFYSVTNDIEKAKELSKVYMHYSVENHKYYLKSFLGAKQALEKIKAKGITIAINSNKSRSQVLLGLEIAGMQSYIDFIVGLDEVEHPKPHPEGVYKIMKQLPDTTYLFVGDTAIDMKTAKNAGVESVGVTWALTSKEQLLQSGAHYTVDSFEEFIRLLEEKYV